MSTQIELLFVKTKYFQTLIKKLLYHSKYTHKSQQNWLSLVRVAKFIFNSEKVNNTYAF